MRRAARLLIRRVGFALLGPSRLFERLSRSLTCATFTSEELASLQVSEWEAFGEQGAFSGLQLFAWETDLFANHIRPNDRILVVGAGAGRDVLPFLEAGHEVTALDITPQALRSLGEKARQRNREVALIHASIDEAELPSANFDVILFSWFCFSYLIGTRKRRAALDRALLGLRPKGRILISYQVRADSDATHIRPSVFGRWVARLLGGVEPERGDAFNVSGSASKPGVFLSHSFAPSEIVNEVEAAGLIVVDHKQATSAVGVLVLAGAPLIAEA